MDSLSSEITDRTTRFARHFVRLETDTSAAFSRFNLSISGDQELLRSHNGQVMATSLVNLTARFHPRLQIVVPDDITTSVWAPFAYDPNLQVCLGNIARMIGTTVDDGGDDVDILLSVGETELEAKHKITINSDGWLSFLSTVDSETSFVSRNQNPIGAMSAACFGAAEAFRRMLELLGSNDRRTRLRHENLIFSALDYSTGNRTAPNPHLPETTRVENVVVVGAGAVANGALFALSNANAEGSISLVDPQTFDETNLNRCLMACLDDVGTSKVAAIAARRPTSLSVIPFECRYEQFSGRREKQDLVVSTIDENDSRIVIQSDLPKVLLHGATGEHVASVSRHTFLDGACLGCLFFENESLATRISCETGLLLQEVEKLLDARNTVAPEHISIISTKTGISLERLNPFLGRPFIELYSREVCGSLTVPVGHQEVTGTASFVSALPGVLLAGEIIKNQVESLNTYSLNNYLSVSLFNPSARWLQERPKDERCRCLCSHPLMVESYKKKWL
jgi:molybdopterin/thiamine biosynthesis adenylyltransferase